jgi:RNA polymerase sigma factor (sigma-70 family)
MLIGEEMAKAFTRAEANATLPLVQVIVADCERVFSETADLESRLQTLPGESAREADALSAEEAAQIEEQLARYRSKREELLGELDQLGVKSVISESGWFSGIHFSTKNGQREVDLCWRISETSVDCWHEQGVPCAEREEVSQSPEAARAYLVAYNGPVCGHTFELNPTISIIGRAPDCEIRIEDYAVSRQHAKIVAEDGAYYLEDLASRNRTYLNDQVVKGGRQRLRDNDRVTVCDVVFRFATGLRGSQLTTALYQSAGPSGGDSDGSLVIGSVTNIIERIGEFEQGALNDLFERVMCDLRDKAKAILHGYPNARGWQAEDLINEIYCPLKRLLETGVIHNRRHLYATACKHFRWKLGEIVRRKQVTYEELSFADPEGDDESPSKLIVRVEDLDRLDEALDALDPGYRQIVEMHNCLDKTFEEIGQELGFPTSTVYDRYRKAMAMLRGFLE